MVQELFIVKGYNKMTQGLPQAHIDGQIAKNLNVEDKDVVAAAIIAQEDRVVTVTKFGLTPEEIAKNDKKNQQSLSKFMTGVDNIVSGNIYSVNQRKRSTTYSDSPTMEVLQEVLELVKDLSYAVAKRRANKRPQSEFTTTKFVNNHMTSTSKFALSKNDKIAKKKRDIELAKLKELKTLHGEIKHALERKYDISEEQVDKIRRGVIKIRRDIHKELGNNMVHNKKDADRRFKNIPSM